MDQNVRMPQNLEIPIQSSLDQSRNHVRPCKLPTWNCPPIKANHDVTRVQNRLPPRVQENLPLQATEAIPLNGITPFPPECVKPLKPLWLGTFSLFSKRRRLKAWSNGEDGGMDAKGVTFVVGLETTTEEEEVVVVSSPISSIMGEHANRRFVPALT